MIKDQEILKVIKISKVFYKIPNKQNTLKPGWQSLLKSLSSIPIQSHKSECFEALSDVNFYLNKGESIGIIGLNGSGKSTLLQIISGTMQPSKGCVDLSGKVAALLELGSGFNPEFTGLENIKLSASLHGLGKQEIRSKTSSIINFADIGDFIYQPVKTYSSGMSLRLAFAVAAHIDSDILIIDEALAVGDARFQIKCFSYLEEFKKRGGSLILVSHDLNSIARLCEKSLLIHKGKVLKICKSLNVINEYSKIIADGVTDKTKNNEKKVKSTLVKKENNYGIDSISYGGKLGTIKNVLINGKQTALINSGDKFTVSFNISSNCFIEKPIFALRIRDNRGQEVYGTNSKLLNEDVPFLRDGDNFNIQYTQTANLGSGEYFISIGFTYYEGDDLKVVHRLRECIKFEIFNEDQSFGISNCFSNITIYK